MCSACCSITINGNTVACAAGCQAVVDTGTTEILGPTKDVNNINGWVGAYSEQVGFTGSQSYEHSFVMVICYSFQIEGEMIYVTNVCGSVKV